MATVPHELREEPATVAPIVLPITSRGLVLTDRLCWGILGVAMAGAAALILYLNRGTTFFVDEVTWFFASTSFNLDDILEQDNGHLVATTRLVYKAILETFGADYLAFRLLGVFSVLLSTALFYALVKRRIGALPALAPTFVLLFLGSDWTHVVVPIAFTVRFSIAAALAALLALERNDRRGDVAACALISLSVATYTIGLAFLAGVAIYVLIRPDRRRRAWIFLVPFALYAAWWLWSQGSAEDPGEAQAKLTNVLLIPSYVADSVASVTAALTGLGYQFSASSPPELGWGPVVATVAIVALALRIKRGSIPSSLWISLGIAFTFWALAALAFGPGRGPTETRYIFPGAVATLLVATAAASGIRFSRFGLVALFAAAAVSLATNLAQLRDGAASFRDGYSRPARAQFAMLELARDHVNPTFDPVTAVPEAAPRPQPHVLGPAATFLATVDRFGSPAYSLAELEAQSESVRQGADQVLASALGLSLEASRAGRSESSCWRVRSDAFGGAVALFDLPAGGASLRVQGAGPAPVSVGRFASPSARVGRLSPGEAATLAIPRDSSPRRWTGSVTGARSVDVCSAS